ncbi:MAG: ectoine/hydroxyectoine ABC transporter substrate-binding protein EhuB, partial [Advenella sp.]
MNRVLKTRTLLALAVATAAAFSTVASAATLQEIKDKGVVRIAVANEIPYGFVDPTGEAKGAGPEVAKHIMEQLG